jgi:hypothetical protein
LLDTPNHPEYVSGHSATGAAGATVLAAIFGDATGFAAHSDTLKNVTRDFDSFSAAAAENALSRLYGGIHYRFSNDAGLALGTAVAEYEVAHALVPVPPVVDPGAGGAWGEAGATGEGGAGAIPQAGQSGAGEAGAVSATGGSQAVAGSGGNAAATGGTGGTGAGGKGGSGGKGGASKGGSGGKGGGNDAGEGGSVAKGGKGGSSSGGKKSSGSGGAAPTEDDSGCGCAVPTESRTSSAPWLFALALLGLRGRRLSRLRSRR